MKFIFSTGSLYPYGIERVFAFAAEAGYDGVELMVDSRWDTRQDAYLLELIQRHSLPVMAVHSPFRPAFGWGKEQPHLISRSVKLAEAVGASVVIHHLPKTIARISFKVGYRKELRFPNPLVELERPYRSWLEDSYRQLQQSTDVTLCIENMPAHTYFGITLNGYMWNAHDHASLAHMMQFPSLTMDTTHLGTWGLEPVDVYAHWGSKVQHVHLSNYDGREHRRPETGHLKLDALLASMARDDYAGCISLELHPDSLESGESDETVVNHMINSLNHCRRWAEVTA